MIDSWRNRMSHRKSKVHRDFRIVVQNRQHTTSTCTPAELRPQQTCQPIPVLSFVQFIHSMTTKAVTTTSSSRNPHRVLLGLAHSPPSPSLVDVVVIMTGEMEMVRRKVCFGCCCERQRSRRWLCDGKTRWAASWQ